MVAIPTRAVLVFLFSLLGLLQGAHSRELFEGEKAPTFARGQYIYADDQIGGYQIYSGNGTWQFEDAKVSTSGGSADSIPLGVIRMTAWEAGEIAATQVIVTNLRSNNGAYWSGAPCDGESLAKRVRGRGRLDDCMTIKVDSTTVGSKQETFLVVHTVQSQTGGRYYIGTVAFNVSYLGFPGTAAPEWNKYTVQSDPAKAALLAKLQSWAELYQDAVAAQMDYRRAADTFAAVPKLKDLKPVSTPVAKPAVVASKGASYVFCESTKSMVLEGSECPVQAVEPPNKTVEKRLQELKELLGKGLIDKEAYQRKRDEILKSL
ncbi:SHOCT domain-containing protein [Rhodoferax bucti]|uniref:SHOCT domain-containing protein n=1 Tax=Rhodoferax bucti TaxID=2576305 RepID=UPI0014768329|nr:SHOCT domain-containing protein [Rhodoferax bucti]